RHLPRAGTRTARTAAWSACGLPLCRGDAARERGGACWSYGSVGCRDYHRAGGADLTATGRWPVFLMEEKKDVTTNFYGRLPNLTRRSLMAGTAALGGTLLVPAMARAQAPQPRTGGTLRVVMPYNPASLDPIAGRNNPDFNALLMLYDALISFDPKTLELQPMLATSWEFADPTTLVV